MNKLVNKYLINNFLKTFLNFILAFISIGIILSLFEEIEFFKSLNVGLATPIILTLLVIPNMMIKLLPFIIFFSAMWYIISAHSNNDLLSLKIFGFSNIRIVFTLSVVAFLLGLFIIFLVTPITSIMIKYYEETKASYSRDVDHLVSINKNGVWIKETILGEKRIISGNKIENGYLTDVSIHIFNKDDKYLRRIDSKKINIIKNIWVLEKAFIFDSKKNNEISKNSVIENYEIQSNYNRDKLKSLYKNLDTLSFLDILTNYENLQAQGYTESLLLEKLNMLISLPFFLFIMVMLAAIFTINSSKKNNNLFYIFISIITGVIIFYFRDLSLALGKTGFIPPILSIWVPIIIISLYCSVGILQINEK